MKKILIKIFKYTMLFLVIGGIVAFLWLDIQLNSMLGKSTEIINISSIVRPVPVIYIKNVAVLSEDCSSFIESQNVLIKDGKIISISTNESIDESRAEIIDGTNKYLIPGLTDSHIHLQESKNDLYLYLANGITSIRDTGGMPITLNWKKAIKERIEIGPRMFVASRYISSIGGIKGYFHKWTRHSIDYTTKEDAQKEIQKIKQQGYDAIKMYSFTNSEMFKVTIEIANEYDIPVIGHIPNEVNLKSFYQSGQKEIAHIEELTKQNMSDFGKPIAKNSKEYLDFLKSHADQIAKELKNNNIYVTSTVALMESFIIQKFDLKSKLKEVPLELVNPKISEGISIAKVGWLPTRNIYEVDELDDPERKKIVETYWETYIEAIRIMTKSLIRNGTLILVGTDANVSPMVPGFSLHEELKTLSGYGMTNTEVLYSATVRSGEWAKSNTGKIKEGYYSDLLLLSKNPLVDIKNTQTIEHVFFDQYMIDKNQISEILKAIEGANNRNRTINIDELTK